MRLQNQRNTLDGGGIGALPSFGQTLLDEAPRIGELRDAKAGGAFAAKIVGKALAISGLSKHARQCELANTARPGEKQRMRNAAGAKSAAQSRDNLVIPGKLGKAHRSARAFHHQ
jgi:hypothetical protein